MAFGLFGRAAGSGVIERRVPVFRRLDQKNALEPGQGRLLAVAFCVALLPRPAVAQDGEVVKLWHAYRGQEQSALEANILWLQQRDPAIRVDILARTSYGRRVQSAVMKSSVSTQRMTNAFS